MLMKLIGEFEDFEKLIGIIVIGGKWTKGENHHQYRAKTDAVLNWWRSTDDIISRT